MKLRPRQIGVTAASVLLIIALRALASRVDLLSAREIAPLQLKALADIMTCWGLPLFFGLWLSERLDSGRIVSNAVGAGVLFLISLVPDVSHILGPEFQLGAPLSYFSGAVLFEVNALWGDRARRKYDPANAPIEKASNVGTAPKLQATLLGICVIIFSFSAFRFVLSERRVTLPSDQARNLGNQHAIVFTSKNCPFSKQLMPHLERTRMRNPAYRILEVDRDNGRGRLLRERMNRLFRVPHHRTSVPALFSSDGVTVGTNQILPRLETQKPETAVLLPRLQLAGVRLVDGVQ